jgi:hypothetical protein
VNNHLHVAGDFVHLFRGGDAVDQILEMNRARDFGQDRERIRIPFQQNLIRLDLGAVAHVDLRAVDNLIAFALALLFVNDDQVPLRFMAINSPLLFLTALTLLKRT